MNSRIKNAIADKLSELYPKSNIYDEFVSQGFKKGSFFIDIIEQDYSKLIDRANRSTVMIDLSYFPESDKESIRSEIDSVKGVLLRGLGDLNGFRIINKTANIVDDILHIQMTIHYRELKGVDQVKMKAMRQNTKSKE